MTAPSDPLSCLAFTAANLLASDHAQSEDGEKTSAGPSGGQGADDQYAMQPAMLKGEAGQRLNLVKDGPPAGGPETQQHGPPAYLSHGSTQQQHTEAAGELGSEDVAYDDGETDEDETDDDEMAMLGTTGHTQTPRLQEHDHPSPRTQQADGARQLAGDPRHGSSRDDHHSTPVQRTPLPGSTAAEATEVQHPSRASQQTGSMLTEGEGDGGGDGSWADVSGCGAPVARGTAGGAAAGGGERVSMLGRGKRPGERRPTQFWQVFNDWWRSELERTGKRPGVESVCGWYDANAAACWGDAAPSLDETRTHAKCLRSVGSIREYFREYRARKRAKTDGAAAPGQDALPGGSSSAPTAAVSAPDCAQSLPSDVQRDGLPCSAAALSHQQLIKLAAQAAAAVALAAHRGPGGGGSGGGGGRGGTCAVGAEGGATALGSLRSLTAAGGAARDTTGAQLPRQLLAAAAAAGTRDPHQQPQQQQRGQPQHHEGAVRWAATENKAIDPGPSPTQAAAAAFAAAAAAALAAATSTGDKQPAAPPLPVVSSGDGASGSQGAAEQLRIGASAYPEGPSTTRVPDLGSSRGGSMERNGSRELPARPGTDGGVYPAAAAGYHNHHPHNHHSYHHHPYYAPEGMRDGSSGGAGGGGETYPRTYAYSEEHRAHRPQHQDAYASPYGHAHRRSPSSLPASARYDDTFAFHSPYYPHSLYPHHPAVRTWLSHQPSPLDPHHPPPRHLTPPQRYSPHPAGYSGGGAPVPLPLSQQLLAAYPTADGAAVVHITPRGGGALPRGPPSAPGAPPEGSTCPQQCYASPRHASQQQQQQHYQQQHQQQQQQPRVCQQDDVHRQQHPSAGGSRGSPREPSAAGGTPPPATSTRAVESAIADGRHGVADPSVGGTHRQAPVREAPAQVDTARAEASHQAAHDTPRPARRVSHSLGGHGDTPTATVPLATGPVPDPHPALQQHQPQPLPKADHHPIPAQCHVQAPATQHRQPVPTAQQQQQQRGPPPGYRVPGRAPPSLPHTGFRSTTSHHAPPGRSASCTDLRHSAAVVFPRPGGHSTPRGTHQPTSGAPVNNVGALPKLPPLQNDATLDDHRASGTGKGPASTTSRTSLTGHEQPQHGSLQHGSRQPQQQGAASGLSGPLDGACSAAAAALDGTAARARPDRLPASASTGGSHPSPAQQQPQPRASGPPALAQGDAAAVSAVAHVALVAGKVLEVHKGERYSEQQRRQPEPHIARPSHPAAPLSASESDGSPAVVGPAAPPAAMPATALTPPGPGRIAVSDSRTQATTIATGEVTAPQAARQANQDTEPCAAAAVAPASVPVSGAACSGRAAGAGGPGWGGQCPSLRSLLARSDGEVVPLLQGCSGEQLAGLLLRALAVVRQKREHEEHLMDQLSQALELQGSLQAQLHAQKLEGARLYRSLMALRDMRSSGGGAGEDLDPDPLPLAPHHRLALSAVGARGQSGAPGAADGGGAGTNGLPPALLRNLGSDVDMEDGGDAGGVYHGDGAALPAGGSSLSHTLAAEGDTEQHRSGLGALQCDGSKEEAVRAAAAGRLAQRRDARASWTGMAAGGVAAMDVGAVAAAFASAGTAAMDMGARMGPRSAVGAGEGNDAGRGCSPAARVPFPGPTGSGGHVRPRSELSCLSGHFGQPHVGEGEQDDDEEAQGKEDWMHLSGGGGRAGFASRGAAPQAPASASGGAREALSRRGEGVLQRDGVAGGMVRPHEHAQQHGDPSIRQRTAQGWERWPAAEADAIGSAGPNHGPVGAGRTSAGASAVTRSNPDAARHRYPPCPGAAAEAPVMMVKAEPGCGAAGGPGVTGPGLLGPGGAPGAAPYSDGGSGSSSAF